MTTATVTLRIKRGTPDEAGRFEDHRVPYRRGMSVLDAVMWIRGHVDSSLSIRYICINANACKECMVLVDGKTQYACTARLGPDGATVEPLPNKRLIRHLVTDIVPPKERLEAALEQTGDAD